MADIEPLTREDREFARKIEFARAYVANGRIGYHAAVEVYGEANRSTTDGRAWRMLRDPVVLQFVEAFSVEAGRRNDITVDTLLDELEQARMLATDQGKAKDMIAATMGKAKVLGLDKQIVEASVNLSPLTPAEAVAIGASFDDKY